jgi:hypothetical protein
VALQEVLQKNEEVENARRGAELTAQQATAMQAAAVRAAEEHAAYGRRVSEALQAHVANARRAYEEELRGQLGALRSEAEQYVSEAGRARNLATEQDVEKTIRELRSREAALRKENEVVEVYARRVLEESRSERVEASKPAPGDVPCTGSSSSMGALSHPTGLPKSFGPAVPPLPKVPSVANRSHPWWDAINRGEGPVLPKAPSRSQGAWTNYKPSQENGSPGTNVSCRFAVPPIIEVPESPTLALRAATPHRASIGIVLWRLKGPSWSQEVWGLVVVYRVIGVRIS